MKTTNLLKIVIVIACIAIAAAILYGYKNFHMSQRLLETEAKYDLMRVELEETEFKYDHIKAKFDELEQTQSTIKKVKLIIEEQNKKLDLTLQNPLESDIKYETVYDDLISGLNYMTEYAYDYCSNSMGDRIIGFYNWQNHNNISLIKLKVVMYEALCYKDPLYISKYIEAVSELISENANTHYD